MRKWTVFCLTLLLPITAMAQPAVVPIQGTLTDANGGVVSGSHSITLRIYSVEAGGAAVYTETQPIMVEQGVFSVYLGDVTALNLATFNGGNLWLGMTVDTDSEMSPRLRFGTVPYAAYAERGGSSIPSGAVMYFDLAACPTGWSPLTQGQGRVIVGLNPAGALKACYPAGCASGALTDQSARNITGTSAVPSHTHTLTNAAEDVHTHSVNPDSFSMTGADGSHDHNGATGGQSANHTHSGDTDNQNTNHHHSIAQNNGAPGGNNCYNPSGACTTSYPTNSANHDHNFTTGTESAGHSHSIGTGGSGHNHTFDLPAKTSAAGSSHNHANTLATTGNTNVDVTMPYVQLLVCRKD